MVALAELLSAERLLESGTGTLRLEPSLGRVEKAELVVKASAAAVPALRNLAQSGALARRALTAGMDRTEAMLPPGGMPKAEQFIRQEASLCPGQLRPTHTSSALQLTAVVVDKGQLDTSPAAARLGCRAESVAVGEPGLVPMESGSLERTLVPPAYRELLELPAPVGLAEMAEKPSVGRSTARRCLSPTSVSVTTPLKAAPAVPEV